MFTWRHFVWLALCLAAIAICLYFYGKKKPRLSAVLSCACVICVISELLKIFDAIEMVPSAGGTTYYPYLSLNHLPLHFCSIQIFFIFFARFSKNPERRENMLAFICPTAILGAIAALAMPSIFSTSVPVEKSFVSPMAYQFFCFHAMLIALGIMILRSGEVKWQKKHVVGTIGGVTVLGFLSIYLNSLFSAPTYAEGKLQSVDFGTNFFFTYRNPLGIRMTEKWQWLIYLGVLLLVTIALLLLFFRFAVFRKGRRKITDGN